MKIQVTKDHIERGLRGSCTSDPIALAMTDAGCIKPWVGPGQIKWLDLYGFWRIAPTPRKVLEFALKFDNQDPTEPFEFELGES